MRKITIEAEFDGEKQRVELNFDEDAGLQEQINMMAHVGTKLIDTSVTMAEEHDLPYPYEYTR